MGKHSVWAFDPKRLSRFRVGVRIFERVGAFSKGRVHFRKGACIHTGLESVEYENPVYRHPGPDVKRQNIPTNRSSSFERHRPDDARAARGRQNGDRETIDSIELVESVA